MKKKSARDLGIPLEGTPGKYNAPPFRGGVATVSRLRRMNYYGAGLNTGCGFSRGVEKNRLGRLIGVNGPPSCRSANGM